MNLKKLAAQQEAAVKRWNDENRKGAAVQVRLDNGDTKETATRSEAWLMGDHTAVVLLEGISGAYALDRVTAISAATGGAL